MLKYGEVMGNDELRNSTEKKVLSVIERLVDTKKLPLSYRMVQEQVDVSDVVIHEFIKGTEYESMLESKRKKVWLKHDIISLVYTEPYIRDMTDILTTYKGTNHNQIIKYLQEEDMRENVPSKYGKIEHKVINFLKEHPQEYSTGDIIEVLDLNRKTFYKIKNSNPDLEQYFRRYSVNGKNIKDLIDNTEEKLTIKEISDKLGLTSVVVKSNLETIEYLDKVSIQPTITEEVVALIKKHPNIFSVMDISEELDISYNTAYKIIERYDLKLKLRE